MLIDALCLRVRRLIDTIRDRAADQAPQRADDHIIHPYANHLFHGTVDRSGSTGQDQDAFKDTGHACLLP
jgi:hypothetical protein